MLSFEPTHDSNSSERFRREETAVLWGVVMLSVGVELCANIWGEEMKLEKVGFAPESARSMVHPIASGWLERPGRMGEHGCANTRRD